MVILEVEEMIRDEFKIFNDKNKICFQIDKMAFASLGTLLSDSRRIFSMLHCFYVVM